MHSSLLRGFVVVPPNNSSHYILEQAEIESQSATRVANHPLFLRHFHQAGDEDCASEDWGGFFCERIAIQRRQGWSDL